MKGFLHFLISFHVIFLLTASAFALDFYKRFDLTAPRTIIGTVPVGGMTRSQTRNILRARIAEFLSEPIMLAARGEVRPVTLSELGVSINESAIAAHIPFAQSMNNAELVLWSVAGRRVLPEAAVTRIELLRVINEKFSDIPRMKNAFFIREKGKLKVAEGQSGLTPQIEPLMAQLKNSIAFFERHPLFLNFQEEKPQVFAIDLERDRDLILSQFPKKITLVYKDAPDGRRNELTELPAWPVGRRLGLGDKKWEADFETHPQWIYFEKKPYAVANGQLPYTLLWDPVPFSQFLKTDPKSPSALLEQAPEGVRIWKDKNGRVQFEGRANEGKAIERERLLTLANNAIANNQNTVEIPVVVVPPKIEIAAELQLMGVRDLVAVGHTKFAGSPVNRQHNIGVGISKFNGLIIPRGETFSFNDNLGVVDDTTGYRKELVIKPEGTIPEFGGGLCQVSTTLYRAAINAGFPITERAPHSYAVTYYSQVGGHGLDATIYPPSRDLKFVNDSPGSILIQSYVDGVDAYFKFYGTLDSREVVLEGPFISNKRSAPTEPLEVQDPKLKPGERKQVEKAHGGFDVLWYRSVTKNGETRKEEIFSKYKATPNKYLVGEEVTAEGENRGLAESPNPFE